CSARATVLVLQPRLLPPSERGNGRFGLFPVRSPLLRESHLISLGQATEMFQFAHAPPSGLYIHPAVSRHHSGGVAPLGDSGLSARMQLPLNVSPVSASVIGLQRRGILHVLCLTCLLLLQTRFCSLARLYACTRCICLPAFLPPPRPRFLCFRSRSSCSRQ